MSVCLCVCTYVCLVPEETRRGHQILGSGVTDGCELNLGPLEELPVLLTAELPLRPR